MAAYFLLVECLRSLTIPPRNRVSHNLVASSSIRILYQILYNYIIIYYRIRFFSIISLLLEGNVRLQETLILRLMEGDRKRRAF